MKKLKLVGEKAFTVVELIIVIAVIGILAVLVLSTVAGVQEDAKISKAESDLQTIHTAVEALAVDTTKWPNGCPVDVLSNPEADITEVAAGLAYEPTVASIDIGCEWTANDIDNWNGPYLADETMLDGWDRQYRFDPDYRPFQNCSTEATLAEVSVVVSYGEDGTEYSCDDIYRVVGSN